MELLRDQVQSFEDAVRRRDAIASPRRLDVAAVPVEAEDRVDDDIGAQDPQGPEEAQIGLARHLPPVVVQRRALPPGDVRAPNIDVALHGLVRPRHGPEVRRVRVDLPGVDGADVRDLGGVREALVHLGAGRVGPQPVVHAVAGQRGGVLELPPVLAVIGDRIGIVVPDGLLPAAGPRLGVDLAHDGLIAGDLRGRVHGLFAGVVIRVFGAVGVWVALERLVNLRENRGDVLRLRRVSGGGERPGDVREGLLAHVSRAGEPPVRAERRALVEGIQDAVGAHQVRVGRVVVTREPRVEARDLVHREVRVHRVRVGVRAVVEAAVRARRAGPGRAPPVLNHVRVVVDRVGPHRVQVVIERRDLRGHRRLRVLLGQKLRLRPTPVVAPSAAARGPAPGLRVHHPVVEHLAQRAARRLRAADHERRVPLEGRVDRLEHVELQRRRLAAAVAHRHVVRPEPAERGLIDLVVGSHGPQRRDRRLRRILRDKRPDRLGRVQIDLRRHVRGQHQAGHHRHVDQALAVEATLHVGVTRHLEELERVRLALSCGEDEARVRQVAAAGALDDVRVEVEDVQARGPRWRPSARGPRAAGVLRGHPVIHVLEAGAGRRVGRHEQEGPDAARPPRRDVRVAVAGERVVDDARLVDDVVLRAPVLVIR